VHQGVGKNGKMKILDPSFVALDLEVQYGKKGRQPDSKGRAKWWLGRDQGSKTILWSRRCSEMAVCLVSRSTLFGPSLMHNSTCQRTHESEICSACMARPWRTFASVRRDMAAFLMLFCVALR
jgi:hypothetical protein